MKRPVNRCMTQSPPCRVPFRPPLSSPTGGIAQASPSSAVSEDDSSRQPAAPAVAGSRARLLVLRAGLGARRGPRVQLRRRDEPAVQGQPLQGPEPALIVAGRLLRAARRQRSPRRACRGSRPSRRRRSRSWRRPGRRPGPPRAPRRRARRSSWGAPRLPSCRISRGRAVYSSSSPGPAACSMADAGLATPRRSSSRA